MTHDLIRRIEKLGSPRIVVIGDLILDRYIWGFAERISQEAPVPLLRADHREHRLGGAASVATMVRTLGAPGAAHRRHWKRRRSVARAVDVG